jgi:hypothetical protein
MTNPILLFLDIEGVLHGFLRPEFEQLPRLEHVMRDFPNLKVVISSNLRTLWRLDDFKNCFSDALRERLLGMTPLSTAIRPKGNYRYAEIIAYLYYEFGANSPSWIALDDDKSLFPPNCEQLVLCPGLMGFDEDAEGVLRARLREIVSKQPKVAICAAQH